MIRQANKFDKPSIIEMLRLFRDESPFDDYKSLENVEYISGLIDNILAGQGVIFIKENVGIIIGLITPTIWSDKIYCMQELAWFVKKEHRQTSAGYRLLVAYINQAKELKKQGRIDFYTMTKMITSPNVKYEKFGFHKIEECWISHD